MPFLGKQPQNGEFKRLDTIITDGSSAYQLLKNGSAQVEYQAEQLLVSVNGTLQGAGSSYTVSGSTITFSEALDSADTIDFIVAMGQAFNTPTVGNGTVTAVKLASDIAITDTPVRINKNSIDANITIGANQNAMVAGPVDINAEIIVHGTFTVV